MTFTRDHHDLGDWRKRFTSPRDIYVIARGYRPCLVCAGVLTLNASGVCVPCRKKPCKHCGVRFTPSMANSTGYCNQCRRYRREGVE